MYIKEYRIPLPMTIDEYRIAQLYMIQKKSLLESTGSGSAVEIIENRPYEDGPGGSGQYTKKIYHIGSHLPSWLKSLLPKTALRVEEEAWNAYPYTKTRHTCPFIEKFFIDIETYYLPDYGQTENVFKLTKAERKHAEVDLIDSVKDSFPSKDYKKEEDPHYFVSTKTGRGPLQDNWLAKYKDDDSCTDPVMCAYKLIRVEFKYWGMQSKIESFIQNAIRNPMLVGHRQAWAWQDEWYGLTIEDIRRLENETQMALAKKMEVITGEVIETDEEDGNAAKKTEDRRESCKEMTNSNLQTACFSIVDRRSSELRAASLVSNQEKLLELHFKNIEQSESDDDDDDDLIFYDAVESVGDNESKIEVSGSDYFNCKPRSESEPSNIILSEVLSPEILSDFAQQQILIFIVQGGSPVDSSIPDDGNLKDYQTFERVFSSACGSCYPGSRNNILLEVIECPSVSHDVFEQIKDLSVYNSTQNSSPFQGANDDGVSNSFPFASVPLFLFESPEFLPTVDDMVKRINIKYKDILDNTRKTPGETEVYLIGDCVGGILLYQALSRNPNDDDTNSCVTDDFHSATDLESLDFSSNYHQMFDFDVSALFTFGCPMGLVCFKQKLKGKALPDLHCGQVYNLFHPHDPMSCRIEPLLDKSFRKIHSAPVPRHQSFPYNDDILYNYSALYENDPLNHETLSMKLSSASERKISSSSNARIAAYKEKMKCDARWWGTKRIDYVLHCPDGLDQFPVSTLMSLCYNSYWESKDLATFVLWQVFSQHQSTSKRPSTVSEIESIMYPKEKWQKKRTKLKIKNMSPNHRANDVVAVTGAQQFISGKFAYGPVDLAALSGEKVDIYMARRPQLADWRFVGTELTDSHGRLMLTRVSKDQEPGVYSLKMVVRGDLTHVNCNMAVLPPQTEAVVFSIDGSFLASYSLRGVDPRIRGGAVDVVRYWQDLGYLIIYVSSRLLFQKDQVMSWLTEHKFPFGVVSFCQHVSTDFQRHKIDFLKNLIKYENVTIHAAYGSSRDIPVYISALKLEPKRVFLVGKKIKSRKAESIQWISDGYANHLNDLRKRSLSKRSANKNIFLALGDFDRAESKCENIDRKLTQTLSGDESSSKALQKSEKGFSRALRRTFRSKAT